MSRLTRFEGRGPLEISKGSPLRLHFLKRFPKGPPFSYVFWKNFQRVPPSLTFFGKNSKGSPLSLTFFEKISKGSPLRLRFLENFLVKIIKGGGVLTFFPPPLNAPLPLTNIIIDWTQDHNLTMASSIWKPFIRFCSLFGFKLVLKQIVFIF